MSIKVTKQVERPSVKVVLKVIDKEGYPVDYQAVWEALKQAFKDHKYYEVYQAEMHPDVEK